MRSPALHKPKMCFEWIRSKRDGGQSWTPLKTTYQFSSTLQICSTFSLLCENYEFTMWQNVNAWILQQDIAVIYSSKCSKTQLIHNCLLRINGHTHEINGHTCWRRCISSLLVWRFLMSTNTTPKVKDIRNILGEALAASLGYKAVYKPHGVLRIADTNFLYK